MVSPVPCSICSMTDKNARLFSNIAEVKLSVPNNIIARQQGNFDKVPPSYTTGVGEALAEMAKT